MTRRGPFQPLLFCDSVILWVPSSWLQKLNTAVWTGSYSHGADRERRVQSKHRCSEHSNKLQLREMLSYQEGSFSLQLILTFRFPPTASALCLAVCKHILQNHTSCKQANMQPDWYPFYLAFSFPRLCWTWKMTWITWIWRILIPQTSIWMKRS